MPKEEEEASIKVDIRISELKKKAEAVLFAAGRTVSVEELSRLIKEDSHELLKEAVREIKKELESKDSPLLLTEESNGNAWKLTVRDKYVEMVRDVSPHTELDKALLGTLAIIAWKHPITQAELVKIRSTAAYEHVAKLLELGFITREKKGRTFIIKVTGKFFEYFDLPDQEAIKKVFGSVADAAEKKEKAAAEDVIVYKAKGMLEEKKEEKKKAVEEMGSEHFGKLDVYESEEKEEEETEEEPKQNKKAKKADEESESEEEQESEEKQEDEEDKEGEKEGIEKSLFSDEEEPKEKAEEAAEEAGHEEKEEQEDEEPEQKEENKLAKGKQEKKGEGEKKRKLSKELEEFAGEEEYIGKEKEKSQFR